MRKLHWAWVVIGATVVAGAGIGIAACSSDTTGTGNPTGGGGSDAGRDSTSSGDDSSSGDDTGTGGETSTLHDCGAFPVKLHPTDDAGPYCPFQEAPDGAPLKGSCALYDTCCLYKSDAGMPSKCVAGDRNACGAEVDAGGAFFECSETADCTGTGKTCCLIGTPTKDPNCLDPTSHEFGSKVKGTYCSANGCKAGEFTVCGAQSECSDAGGTCTPFSTKTIEIGACVQ